MIEFSSHQGAENISVTLTISSLQLYNEIEGRIVLEEEDIKGAGLELQYLLDNNPAVTGILNELMGLSIGHNKSNLDPIQYAAFLIEALEVFAQR